MAMINTPTYQRLFTWLVYALIGFIALGNFLDAINNAQFLSPLLTYLASTIIIIFWISLCLYLKKYSLRWVINGQEFKLRRLGIKPTLALVGMVLLLWIPRMIDVARAVRRPASVPNSTTEVDKNTKNTPPEDPLSGRINILVAEFQGPDPQKYGVTSIIFEQLEAAIKEFPDVGIRRLDEVISSTEEANGKGKGKHADIVLWGSYLVNDKNARVTVHFDVLHGYSPQQSKQTFNVGLDKLLTFKIQEQLSREMTYLTLLTIGIARHAAGDYDGAINRLTAALKNKALPKSIVTPAVVHVYRGVSYHQKHDVNRAIADYSQAITMQPTLAVALIRRCAAYAEKGRLNVGLADCNKAIASEPGYAKAYLFRGVIYAKRKNLDKAIIDFRKSIELDNNYADAYVRRGMWHHDQGNDDAAIADFDKAISLDPSNALAYFQRGSHHALKREFAPAISDLNLAIKHAPNEALYYITRGHIYSLKGDYDHAVEDLTRGITIDRTIDGAYLARGDAYLNKNDLDHAIEDFNRAAKQEPHNADVYMKRGRAYEMKRGRPYEMGTEGHDEIKHYLDKALRDFDQVVKIQPANAEGYKRRGEIYFYKDDRARALRDFNTAIRLNSNDAEAYYFRGLNHAFMGDIERAKKDLATGKELSRDLQLRQLGEELSRAIESLDQLSRMPGGKQRE